MDPQFIQILLTLSKAVPVIAVLFLCVRYFLKKEKGYVDKINELQEELRKNEKETLMLMNRLTVTLDKVVENSSESTKEVLEEIKSLSKHLTSKINELKKEK